VTSIACIGPSTETDLPEPSYSGEITENLLISLNEQNFSKFSQDFDDGMKKAITQESFETQFINNIRGKIGDYVPNSKRFYSSSKQAQYTTVVYAAIYTEEPGSVLIQISFQQIEGRPFISGIYYNSPKLRS
jgi:hypothetical protein